MRQTAAVLTVVFLSFTADLGASMLASTNFDGRTVAGATASNLTWILNGVANPGNLTAVVSPPVIGTPPPMALFNTAAAQNRFAVDRNLHTESAWYVDIPLNVGSIPLALSTVTLDALIFNNAGNLQTQQRDLDMRVDLFLSPSTLIDTVAVNNIYAPNGPITPPQPRPVSFDLTGNILSASTTYTLRLRASGTGPGNNAGFDNLSINGSSAVPEPLSLVVWSTLGAIGLVGSRLRR